MPLSAEAARIITTDQARAERCFVEIRRVLEAHGCQIEPVVQIIGGKLQTGFNVVAIPAMPSGVK